MKSMSGTVAAAQEIAFSPEDAYLVGKEGNEAHAEWEIGYEMQAVSGVGGMAAAEASIHMWWEYGITDMNPYYGGDE